MAFLCRTICPCQAVLLAIECKEEPLVVGLLTSLTNDDTIDARKIIRTHLSSILNLTGLRTFHFVCLLLDWNFSASNLCSSSNLI